MFRQSWTNEYRKIITMLGSALMAFQNIFIVVFTPQKNTILLIRVASFHVWALNYANIFDFHLFRSLAGAKKDVLYSLLHQSFFKRANTLTFLCTVLSCLNWVICPRASAGLTTQGIASMLSIKKIKLFSNRYLALKAGWVNSKYLYRIDDH